MSLPTPAPLPPKPGKVKVFRALYPYTAQQPDELTFEEGDLLYVTDQNSSAEWWHAKCGKRNGLIPSNYVSESTETITFPLHDAAKRGNMTFLEECLANEVSVNSLDKSGSTAIYWAAHSGCEEAVKRLLSCANISIDAQNKLGDTALHAAAWKGHASCVRLLLEAGAKTSTRNLERKTPLELATNPEAAALLKQYTTPITDQGDYGSSSDGEQSE